MSLLGFIPKVLKFFGKKDSSREKSQGSIILLRDRYKIHISAQGFIDRRRKRKKDI